MRCRTDQRSISTKLQTSLYMMTDSTSQCLAGTLVYKFQKPLDVFDASCMYVCLVEGFHWLFNADDNIEMFLYAGEVI